MAFAVVFFICYSSSEMRQGIILFSIIWLLLGILVISGLCAPDTRSNQQHGRKAELNSLILAAKLLERQLNQVVTRLESVSAQDVLSENQGLKKDVLGHVGSDVLLSELVQLVLWVNNKGGVFKTYPESALSNDTRFVGPAVFRLIGRSARERKAVASSITTLPGGSRGFWVVFPVFQDGLRIYSVVCAIELESVGRMVAPSLRQKIFVLDEEGQFSVPEEDLPSFVGWDASLVLSGGAASAISSLTDLVSVSAPGILELTEPPQVSKKQSRVIQMVVAPFTFLDRRCALCSMHPIAGPNVLVAKQGYPMYMALVLSIVAAVLALLALRFLTRRSCRSVSVQKEMTDVFNESGFPIFQEFFGALPIPVFMADIDGSFVAANPSFCLLVRIPTLCHMPVRRIDAVFGEQSQGRTQAFIDAVLAVGSARTEMLLKGPGNENVAVQMDGFAIESDGMERILVMCLDKGQSSEMAPNKKHAAIADDSYLEAILNGLNEAVMVVGCDYIVKRVNKNLLRLVGADSEDKVLGRSCHDVFHGFAEPCSGELASCPVKEVLAKGRSISIVHEQKDKDGLKEFTEIFAYPIEAPRHEREILVSLKDITEKSQLSAQLSRADKLKALGEMAAGVAHDFNNLLGVILGRTQMLIRMIGGDDAGTRRNLEIIERTALDGAETVRRIQEFTRVGDTSSFVPVDLNEIIEDSIGITKPRWKDQMQVQGIVIRTELKRAEIPPVAGKPSELRELFVNLINNSIDAIPKGGRITLETGTRDGAVHVRVRDNGDGIPPKIVNNIFDPFFTTREPMNSGLGLSIVIGIIERHGGSIDVRSELGKFTEFSIEIPALLDDFKEAKLPKVEQVELQPALSSARVLIIDDEADIRNLLVDMLAGEGHKVDIASSGEEGIRKCKREKYDYVITDLGMPHMSGWEVARKVKALRPQTTVILATGWGIHFDEEKLKSAGINRIITKPFQVDEVLTCINGRRH